ncbi:MAG: conjugal transfer protein TraG, partial [Gammaproteobacteria bacterium]
MSVSTYLELYLTLYGWVLYDGFWEIITDTGIAYLPFIGMFLRNIVEPIKSQDAKDASTTSLRRIEIDIIIMFTVVVLAVQPIMTINSTSLGYTKSC